MSLSDLGRALGPFGTRAHATRAAGAITRALAETEPEQVPAVLDEAVAASSLAVPDRLTALMSRLSARGLFEPAACAREFI